MIAITDALGGALRSLFSVRMLWLMIWPLLLAIVLWGVLGLVFWDQMQALWLKLWEFLNLGEWLHNIEPDWIATALNALFHVLFFIPLVWLTAFFITALFGMPIMLDHVARNAFPLLEKRHGGSFAGSLANAGVALVLWIGLWLLVLPLLFIPPLAALLPIIATGYLNQRLFRYDALADHADRHELAGLLRSERNRLWGLGILLGLLQLIPLLNILIPVYTGLAFIHYLLGRLAERRTGSA
jgi:hypothetical protein